jgi:hypothetical protein
LLFGIFSLVDLGEDNDRNLKMPSQIAAEKAAAGGIETVETSEKAATQMAEQAGEKPATVNKLTKRENRIKYSSSSDKENFYVITIEYPL